MNEDYMNDYFKSIYETIKVRVKNRLDVDFLKLFTKTTECTSFYVAGNSLNRKNPNDIDIYLKETSFKDVENKILNCKQFHIITSTKNAITFSFNSKVYQVCNYYHPSLDELVESFDFAHIKIGVDVDYTNKILVINRVYVSDDWIKAHLQEDTYFTNTKYPLSSLIRSYKYKERGDFSGNSHIYSVLKILCKIIDRGFENYEDFKDQLDAVDLGLVPEDLEGCQEVLLNLYNLLKRG